MRADGELEIDASREATWDVLTDPDALVACVPGAGSLSIERVSATAFTLRGRVGQGFLKLPAEGQVELSGLARPASAEARLHGSAAGTSLEATVVMSLEETAPQRTLLRWSADASIDGPLAGMAQPYLDREGPAVVQRTLDCLQARLGSGSEPDAA
jgi:uncharacterized protein